MPELSDRQKLILTLVIREYLRTARPVGSEPLVKDYHLEMSSATIRNELMALTDEGYLRQTHTSSGRVPTEDGYRYFVSRLLQETELPDTTRHMISHQFFQMRSDVEQWSRLAASVLAQQSHGASLVTAPHPTKARFKHLELISTHGRQVLMVLVMVGGDIRQRILTLNEQLSQEQLSSAAQHATDLFLGMDIYKIQKLRPQLQGIDLDVLDWVVEDMRQSNALISGEVFLDGFTNVLAEPEFTQSEEARQALHVLEERSILQDLLARTILNSGGGGVQVIIGGEGTWNELRHCSLVLSRYGTPGLATGTLGVLGPMRMSYGRAISTVRFLSGLLSELVSDALVE